MLQLLAPHVQTMGGMGKISESVLRAIIDAPAAVFRFPTYCSNWKPERFKVEWCWKSSPNFAFFDLPCWN